MGVRAPTKTIRSWMTDSTRWQAYRPREGDVVVATAVKAGTTWTIQIVHLLIRQSPDPRPIWFLSPWFEARSSALDQQIASLDAQKRRRVIKTHLSSDALPLHDNVRYIHTARDGRDAFMSWHNHVSTYTPVMQSLMDANGIADPEIGRPHPPLPPKDIHTYFGTWMTEGPEACFADDMPATRYFDTGRSFWRDRHLPNVLLVHFNDLKADLDGEMRRIAAFLDIAVDEADWPSLVEAASFERMRESGQTLIPLSPAVWKEGPQSFFHKGSSEQWCGVLTDAEIARYEERVSREFSPSLAAWASHGRLVTGDPRAMED